MGALKELLAKPDVIRITTPVLSPETLQRVLDVIRHDVASDKVRIDNPTQNLESYFLEVVQKARQSAAATSGAISGARVAAYLRGEAEAGPAAERVLERLALPQAQPAEPATVPPAARTVDEKKLEELTRADETIPSPAGPAPAGAETPADLSEADEKLSSLLGKQKP
jgi:hypothetical protein